MVGRSNLHSITLYSLKTCVLLNFMTPIISATESGLTVTIDGISYLMQWVDSMLKVTGPDVCYYILETSRGIEQADCAFKVFNVLIANF